jgi:hypothetical protein
MRVQILAISDSLFMNLSDTTRCAPFQKALPCRLLFRSMFCLSVVGMAMGVMPTKAETVSIAKYIDDPGFETAHDPNQLINTSEQKAVNGWGGLPKDGNAWTSISYVDAGGKTLGDSQNAIDPAEGKSYLRMFTKNSWDWLSFTTSPFPLVSGTTYEIAFKVSTDREMPMSKLNIGLRDRVKGEYHGLTAYDLSTLEPGWNTIVYRWRYDGPNQAGVLQITGRREKADKVGSLNFDDFRVPSSDEQTRVKSLLVETLKP